MTKGQLKPTSGRQWRKPTVDGETIRLPSGNVATIRAVALDILILSGQIPDLLTPLAASTLWEDKDVKTIANDDRLSKGYVELINVVLPAAFVNPKIVANPVKEDEIGLQDISWTDKTSVFNLCLLPANLLHEFRVQQDRDVESLPNGEDTQPTAKPDGED